MPAPSAYERASGCPQRVQKLRPGRFCVPQVAQVSITEPASIEVPGRRLPHLVQNLLTGAFGAWQVWHSCVQELTFEKPLERLCPASVATTARGSMQLKLWPQRRQKRICVLLIVPQ